jgi:hypothetical protein
MVGRQLITSTVLMDIHGSFFGKTYLIIGIKVAQLGFGDI